MTEGLKTGPPQSTGMPSLSSGFLIGKGLESLQGGFDKLKQGV
jgi:hypothetical protein